MNNKALITFIDIVTKKLSVRERQILNMRYIDHLTYKMIGNSFGVSPERIRQIESRALAKLKHEPKTINPFEIGELKLSFRTYNCLRRTRIDTVFDLLETSDKELLEIRNFGSKCLNEIKEAIKTARRDNN